MSIVVWFGVCVSRRVGGGGGRERERKRGLGGFEERERAKDERRKKVLIFSG